MKIKNYYLYATIFVAISLAITTLILMLNIQNINLAVLFISIGLIIIDAVCLGWLIAKAMQVYAHNLEVDMLKDFMEMLREECGEDEETDETPFEEFIND